MAKWFRGTGLVELDIAARVARITLNRPEKRNALSHQLLAELYGAMLEADDRLDVSVIILEGAGRDFCAGFDLTSVYSSDDKVDLEAEKYRKTTRGIDDDVWDIERINDWMGVVLKIHKPVIAKIQGNCLAAGTDLALSCDLLVAANDARIGFPATRANGSPPTHMWTYHVGPQWAKRLLMTGDALSGRDAAKIGLVLDAVPPDELDSEVNELARRMTYVDADLLAAQKRVVNMALELQGAEVLRRLAAENDARAHLSRGPRRTQFRRDMVDGGVKLAVKNRDAPFGDGMVRVRDYS